MKKMMYMVVMMAMSIYASAMSYSAVRNEALFLSDKMAYELNLTKAQYNDVYEINLDYMMSVNRRNDVYGSAWSRRNTELQHVLTAYQYNKYVGANYFYRPMTWKNGNWSYNIYSRYSNRNHYYNSHPQTYATYRGNTTSNNRYSHRGNNSSSHNNHATTHSTHNSNNPSTPHTNNNSTSHTCQQPTQHTTSHTTQHTTSHTTQHTTQHTSSLAYNSNNTNHHTSQTSHRGNK